MYLLRASAIGKWLLVLYFKNCISFLAGRALKVWSLVISLTVYTANSVITACSGCVIFSGFSADSFIFAFAGSMGILPANQALTRPIVERSYLFNHVEHFYDTGDGCTKNSNNTRFVRVGCCVIFLHESAHFFNLYIILGLNFSSQVFQSDWLVDILDDKPRPNSFLLDLSFYGHW